MTNAGFAQIAKGANFSANDVPESIERSLLSFRAEDGGLSRGVLYAPKGPAPRVGIHLMHPRTDQTHNYNILPLARAGYAVLGRAGRWVNNDINTIHERLLLDIAAGVRELRARGCEQVLLLGNSGGGPLATLYQAQARRALGERYTDTAAGDFFDLNAFDLPAADGIILIGTHLGPGHSLAKWLDPSLVDEGDPLSVDPALDMYAFSNGFRVPPEPSVYDADFLDRFRRAQTQRMERLDRIARSRIARRRAAAAEAQAAADRDGFGSTWQAFARRAAASDHLVLFRAQADPSWLDPAIMNDDHDICSFANHPRPDLANYDVYLSPILTPEAYLSSWSGLSSRARTADRMREIPDPAIVVHYGGDSCCPLGEARQMFEASTNDLKEFHVVPKVDHYAFPITGPHQRGERDMTGTEAAVAWLERHFPI
jgi:pimeloyl-ACP methyl ester carboxylesterase